MKTARDNTDMDFKEMWFDGLDRIHLSQDTVYWWALVNMVMNFRVSLKAGTLIR
jgi:hypothetical protein